MRTLLPSADIETFNLKVPICNRSSQWQRVFSNDPLFSRNFKVLEAKRVQHFSNSQTIAKLSLANCLDLKRKNFDLTPDEYGVESFAKCFNEKFSLKIIENKF